MKRLLFITMLFSSLFTYSQSEEIEDLMIELAYQNSDSAKIDTSIKLIDALFKIEDYSRALKHIDQTQKLAKSLNYVKGTAEANYYKALIYSQNDDYLNAIDSYGKSKQYFQQLKDTLGIAKVNNSIGIIEIKRGNYLVGLKSSLSAIEIFESKNLQDELSKAYNNLGEAYFNTNQVDKALEFNLKALGVRQQLRDSSGIKWSTTNIAKLYSMRKEHRKAIEYYENVLKILDPKADQQLKGKILPLIGDEYLQFREYDKAGKYLFEGLRYNRRENNKDGILRSLNSIGNLNLQRRNLRTAENQLNEAYAIAQELDNKSELLKNYKLHIALDSTRGYYQNAFFWQNKYFDLKQDLDKLNQPKIALDIDPDTDLIETEPIIPSENTLSNADSKLLKKLKWITYGLGAALAFVLLFTLINYFNSKKRNEYILDLERTQTKLLGQNENYHDQIENLEEINKVKDRLFSIVSHDLKDSISSIKAFIDLLKEDSISKKEFKQLIPELSENADNASLLLFNLLNWSKSQMQNLEPKPELFNIQDVFETKMALVEQKVEKKKIVLIDESQRDFAYADRSMIEIVVQNLITNAVKFSRDGDVITVSNYDANGKLIFSVEDTGVGISKENIDKLFKNDAFTTIGTKNEKGTGLGLTICKELVELNQGRIWVESTPNVGSKFFVELPKSERSPS
ncbi:tetratricopeptide repeat-containing sensor histidine kinase [Ichthyenterobacterium sp. W332]|uniref:histidine kinase n=1 Tax=Microcosmobacter mediterraneus TaxID=3075607 RepID=A0ABU2YPX6_9FLAO|nr:tetratricopeptide repeat-containing sensor histidine kinase [Ichthyenterobacterium sp. W332]MDT0559315.1 tetratricopeptide repeat-containing sensor histidine kinase [Ichthyenterobacterium sp. W332]